MKTEPRVEELLATIRKAIDNDIGQLDAADAAKTPLLKSSPIRGSLREMKVTFSEPERAPKKADEDINSLRERVGRNRLDTAMSVPSPVVPPKPALRPLRDSGVGRILSGDYPAKRVEPPPLRGGFAEEVEPMPQTSRFAYADPVYDVPEQQPWPEEPQMPDPNYQQQAAPPAGALMSPQATYQAQNSFQALADSMMAQMSGDGRLDDVAREMLRPLLQRWLDENLPAMVERLVREEIERVARRGR